MNLLAWKSLVYLSVALAWAGSGATRGLGDTVHFKVLDSVTEKPLQRFSYRVTSTSDRKPTDKRFPLSGFGVFRPKGVDNASGLFYRRGLDAGQAIQVSLSAEGYLRSHVRRVVVGIDTTKENPFVVNMTPVAEVQTTSVSGVLVDRDGNSIADTAVGMVGFEKRKPNEKPYLIRPNGLAHGDLETNPRVRQLLAMTTDEEGRFNFNQVACLDDVRMVATPDGFYPLLNQKVSLTNSNGDVQDVKLVVGQGGDLAILADTESIPAGTQIFLTTSDLSIDYDVRMNRKGFVKIKGLPPGSYQISAIGLAPTKRDGNRMPFTPTRLATATVTLTIGETTTVRLLGKK